MPISIIINESVHDFHYRTIDANFTAYHFYIGEIYVGQITKMRRSWSCSSSKPTSFGVVNGFATRYDASNFLLTIGGFREQREDEDDPLRRYIPNMWRVVYKEITGDAYSRGWETLIVDVSSFDDIKRHHDIISVTPMFVVMGGKPLPEESYQ